jgi:site-specific DNA-methyltransferase (adenine-specific)
MQPTFVTTMPNDSIAPLLGKIHNGDCLEGLQGLPDGSIDLVFADPPFNIGYKYDQYEDTLAADEYLEWSRQWIKEVYRVLKPDGTFWLAIGDEYAAELKIESQKIGFIPRNWVVWYYTFGVHCRLKFTRSHAHLFYFVKNAKKHTFNRQSIAVPSARQLVYGDKRANAKGRTPDDTWVLRPQDIPDSFTADEDTWYLPRVAGTFKERAGFHGCQMPEQLLGRIIRACSDEGEIVVDPFSGSSTTLTVAKKLGRNFFGFELSKDYAERGTARLNAANVGDRLEGADEPTVSAPATNSEHAKKKRNKPKKPTPKKSAQQNLPFE